MTTTTRPRARDLGNLTDADRRVYRCTRCGAWRYRNRYREPGSPAHWCAPRRPRT